MEESTQTQSIPQNPEAEIGMHQIGVAPILENTPVEKRAVESFKVFVGAEVKRHDAGIAFGQAVFDLREEIRSSGDRDFMKRLEQLGISYEKARYWMAKIERKRTDRHKEHEEPTEEQEEPTFDWDVAVMQLKALSDAVKMLKKSKPVGSDDLVKLLTSLVDLLDYQIVSKGGKNEYLLQRVRPECGSVAEGTDDGRTDSSGGGR